MARRAPGAMQRATRPWNEPPGHGINQSQGRMGGVEGRMGGVEGRMGRGGVGRGRGGGGGGFFFHFEK